MIGKFEVQLIESQKKTNIVRESDGCPASALLNDVC